MSFTLGILLVAVLVPLALNTATVLLLHGWTQAIHRAAAEWAQRIPGAEVTDVQFRANAVVPSGLAIVLDTTYGEEITVGTRGAP